MKFPCLPTKASCWKLLGEHKSFETETEFWEINSWSFTVMFANEQGTSVRKCESWLGWGHESFAQDLLQSPFIYVTNTSCKKSRAMQSNYYSAGAQLPLWATHLYTKVRSCNWTLFSRGHIRAKLLLVSTVGAGDYSYTRALVFISPGPG